MDIESLLGYHFKNPDYLALALTHSSWSNEHGSGHLGCNERLEFLGDSILGFLVADYLYRTLPDKPEGILSHTRSELVCEAALSRSAEKLHLGFNLKLGKGEELSGGSNRPSITSDALEAVIAAVFLDGGIDAAKDVVYSLIIPEQPDYVSETDYKTALQEVIQSKKNQVLSYQLLSETGPDHNKSFSMAVLLNGTQISVGNGTSKKRAQQSAAKAAMEYLAKNEAP